MADLFIVLDGVFDPFLLLDFSGVLDFDLDCRAGVGDFLTALALVVLGDLVAFAGFDLDSVLGLGFSYFLEDLDVGLGDFLTDFGFDLGLGLTSVLLLLIDAFLVVLHLGSDFFTALVDDFLEGALVVGLLGFGVTLVVDDLLGLELLLIADTTSGDLDLETDFLVSFFGFYGVLVIFFTDLGFGYGLASFGRVVVDLLVVHLPDGASGLALGFGFGAAFGPLLLTLIEVTIDG